ncbi:hypothetical protein [Actinomadura rubrisoli]|uniref:Phage tail protein n=1 Tax=Actinomadura rubrisoli TaxID=2530368 RepID=A0A4R5CB46_9ACTN|nr:hypothetical protein [Actinomadura rubrisoli]TDD97171.1 hypothetical protein E1298_01680 [Actinomadura rubrisoli]
MASTTEAASKLPVDVTTPLDAVFKDLGYISEDGVSVTPKREFDPVNASQSASPIKYVLKSAALTLKFVLLQMDPETVEVYFGTEWVTTSGVNKLNIASNPALAEICLVVEYGDYVQTETSPGPPPVYTLTGTKNRLVIPRGMVSDVDEYKIARTDTLALGVTFDAMDKSGSLGFLLSNASA